MKIETNTSKLTHTVDLDVNEALLLIASLSEAVRLIAGNKVVAAFAGGVDCEVSAGGRAYLGTANFTVVKEHA